MLETGTRRSSWIGPLAKLAAAAGAEAAEGPPAFCESTSARRIRPPGPLPVIRARSRPFSAANFRASGEILDSPARTGPARGPPGGPPARVRRPGPDSGPGQPPERARRPPGRLGEPRPREPAPSRPACRSRRGRRPAAPASPPGTKTARSVPSKKLSSSIVALSVSTSASMSPVWTASPSFFSHFTSVPTVMVSLSFGISMMLAMGGAG